MGIALAPPAINRAHGVLGVQFDGKAPDTPGASPAVAAADHGHAQNALGRAPIEFGLAVSLATTDSNPGAGRIALVTGVGAVPALATWTIEWWQAALAHGGVGGATSGIGLWAPTSGTDPFPGATGQPTVGAFEPASDPGDFQVAFPDGSTVDSGTAHGTLCHVAIACDGGATRLFVAGALVATKPAYALPAGYVYGALCDGAITGWDEFRVSTMARYTAAFAPPAAPFTADAFTALLWHFDDLPDLQFLNVASAANGPTVTGSQSGVTQDASGNGAVGELTWVLDANAAYGSAATATGASSTVTAGSGPGPASSVLSIAGLRGDLTLSQINLPDVTTFRNPGGVAASGPAAVSLPTVAATLGADVALAAATETTVLSVTLPVGTHRVGWGVTVLNGGSTAGTVEATLAAGTAVYGVAGGQTAGQTELPALAVPVALGGVATLTVTTAGTVLLRATAGVAATAKAATPTSAYAGACGLDALQVA